MKPGATTTEFWITMIPYILLIIKQLTGLEFQGDLIIQGITGAIAVVTTVTYVIGRVQLKKEEMKLKFGPPQA